ncbi:unnamed protein product [Linum trigynum]|uniref:Endonuclease/exonuclease/phosphatase n=1 Tax=Linum trigynum TaxID=586398 RepID=A0AAV2F6Z7_9ROSI
MVLFQPINDAYFKDWRAEQDLRSIISAGRTLHRFLNFSPEFSSDKVDSQFEDLAFSFKSKKKRTSRSKLQMEIHRLGTLNSVMTKSRRKKGPSGNSKSGILASFPMNDSILAWNVRGLGDSDKRARLKPIIRQCRTVVVGLIETKWN